MPRDKLKGQRGHCRTCGKPVSGKGRRYCEGCQPPIKIRGHVLVYAPKHYRANKGGYVWEHVVVAEKKLGRSLELQEVVHHTDGNKANNDPDNLQVFPSNGAHTAHHSTLRSILRKCEIAHNLERIGRDDWLLCWHNLETPYDGGKQYLRACGYEGLAVWHAHCIVMAVRSKLVTHDGYCWGPHIFSKWTELAQQHEKTFLAVVDRYISNLKAGGQIQPWKTIPRILREVTG